MSNRIAPFEARFRARLEPADNGCIVWTGARNARGYGRVSTAKIPNLPRITYAHRVAYYIATGETPALLRHTCDNPPCCNPHHLLPGTQQDNMRDAVERGQITRGPRRLNERGHPYWTCQCGDCRDDRRTYRRNGARRRADAGPPEHAVGSVNYYQNYGCRCDLCVQAAYGADARPRPSYPYVRMSVAVRTLSNATTTGARP